MTRARSNDPTVWERRKEDRREKRRKHKQKLDAKKVQDLQSKKNEDAEMHDETGVMSTSRHPAAASMPPKKLRSEPKRVDKRKGVRERMKRRTAILKDAAAEETTARKAVWKDYVKNQKTKARDRKENSNNGGEVGQQGGGGGGGGGELVLKFIGVIMKDANQASGENGDRMNSAGGLMFAGLAFRPKV